MRRPCSRPEERCPMRAAAAAALTLVSSLAFAEVDLPSYDAFLESPVRQEIDLKAMPEAVAFGRISATEPRHGVPTFFWAGRDGKGLKALGITAEQAARRYLFTYAPLYRATGPALAETRLRALHDIGTGAIVAAFQRDEGGVKVFNDEL